MESRQGVRASREWTGIREMSSLYLKENRLFNVVKRSDFLQQLISASKNMHFQFWSSEIQWKKNVQIFPTKVAFQGTTADWKPHHKQSCTGFLLQKNAMLF